MCLYFLNIPLIKETGGSHINETEPPQEFKSRYSLYEFGRSEFPVIKVDHLLLNKDAYFEDILSIEMISRGILMNKKSLELFLDARLPKYKVYPLKVKNYKGEIRNYFLLHFST